MKLQSSGLLALLLAAFVFATFGVYIRVLNQDLNAYQQIFFRGLMGFIIAAGIIAFQKKNISLSGLSKPMLAAYTFSFPLVVILFTFSILSTKIASTLFGFYVGTLSSSLIIGVAFFKEAINLRKKVALFLALVGLVVYTHPLSISNFDFGLLLAIGSGSLDAFSNALRKHVDGKLDRLTLVAIQVLGMAIISSPFILLLHNEGLPTLSLVTWLTGAWFGLMLVLVNYLLLYGFSHFDLNLGSIVLAAELFFGAVIGFIFFGEILRWQEVIGSLIIVAAIGVISLGLGGIQKQFEQILKSVASD